MNPIARVVTLLIAFSCYFSLGAQHVDRLNPTSPNLSKNKALAIRFCNEVINGHNVDLVDEMVAKDYVEHQADRHYLNTRYGLKRGLRNFIAAFPDLHLRINFITEEANIVTAHYTMTGTHSSNMYQHRATKRKINVEGVDIIRIENGKIVEHWGYTEEGKLLRQLRTRPSEMDENDMMKIAPKGKETSAE